MSWCFNTPKVNRFSCVTSPIQKEKTKIVVLSISNVLGKTPMYHTSFSKIERSLNLSFEILVLSIDGFLREINEMSTTAVTPVLMLLLSVKMSFDYNTN